MIDSVREEYGLDRPVHVQFATYAAKVARGDLGTSFAYARPVTTIIRERLPATLLLAGSALVVSVLGGMLLGMVSARRSSGAVDAGVRGLVLVGYAVPGFWLAELAILFFGLRLQLFPVIGMTDTRIQYTGIDYVADVGRHMVLPVMVLAVSEIALVMRLTRIGLIQQMREGYARTAEAKGLPTGTVLSRHALPNAALPLVTVIGTRVGFLFSGAVVIETVFSWPGLGLLLVNSVRTGDRPMALGMVLIVAAAVVVANLVTDLAYAWIDPRISYD